MSFNENKQQLEFATDMPDLTIVGEYMLMVIVLERYPPNDYEELNFADFPSNFNAFPNVADFKVYMQNAKIIKNLQAGLDKGIDAEEVVEFLAENYEVYSNIDASSCAAATTDEGLEACLNKKEEEYEESLEIEELVVEKEEFDPTVK